MKKVLKCETAGFTCPHQIIGATDEEVLEHAAQHFAEAHDKTVDEAREISQRVRESIMDQA